MIRTVEVTEHAMVSAISAQTVSQAAAPANRFIVGQDVSGQWLAVDLVHRGGGLFKSRADAIHFAASESGRGPDSIRVSPVPLRLEF